MPKTLTLNNDQLFDVRLSFKEVYRRCSPIELLGENLFFKHPSLDDEIELQTEYRSKIKKAVSQGVPTEEELNESLIKSGEWTSKKDLDIKNIMGFVENLHKTKSKLMDDGQKKQIDQDIRSATQQLLELLSEKEGLFRHCAEYHARSQSLTSEIEIAVYRDKDLFERRFSREELESLYDRELNEIKNGILVCKDRFSESGLANIAASEFFQDIFESYKEDIGKIFGLPAIEISVFQSRLWNLGRTFRAVYEKFPDIPEEFLKTPYTIIDYVNQNEKRKTVSKIKEGASGESINPLEFMRNSNKNRVDGKDIAKIV